MQDSSTTSPETDPDAFLARFGLNSFRPGQRDVIESVLAGHDCLCIMPTGGGKSLCYQLPSVARQGVTLVVSPLIALMKDQVDSLSARGINATFINSTLSLEEQRQRMSDMRTGAYDLVYIAPERLRNRAFIDAVSGMQVQLLAVDEAHCISEWGHDFRPDYARLGRLRESLGNPQTIALTATATPLVRRDVLENLRLKEPRTFITGFARPNLHFEVRETWGKAQKEEALFDLLEEIEGAGIIYAGTRKRCEEVVEMLRASDLQRSVEVYHAGLEPDTRRAVQERFMSGQLPVIVATNAFGMGIDKSDLRFVIHYDLPGSLEAYYQEAGRAGRDGRDSRCVLLFNERDRWIQEFFIESSYPARDKIRKVYEYLRRLADDPIQLTLQEIKEASGVDISGEGVSACEKILEKAGALKRLDTRQNNASACLSSDLPSLVDLVPKEAKSQRKVLRAIEKLAGDVRHEYIYFPAAKLEAMCELEPATITRALRELKRLDCFDYIPPFRGRAIRVLDRDKPFEKIEIDFAELDRRKGAEYEKLEYVITYARTRRCRQVEILDYFGDEALHKCHACDNCGGLHRTTGETSSGASDGSLAKVSATSETVVAPVVATTNDDPQSLAQRTLKVVRMALSGVARTEGKVGKGIIARMLHGSQAKEIKRMRFNELSTFGLLKDWRQDEIGSLLDSLQTARLIEQRSTTQFRPLVHLSDLGRRVMKGEETVDLYDRLSPEVRSRIDPNSPVNAQDQNPLAQLPYCYWTWRLHGDGYSIEEIAAIRRLSIAKIQEQLAEAAQLDFTEVESNLPVSE